jgi:hypothetical protein
MSERSERIVVDTLSITSPPLSLTGSPYADLGAPT